MHLFDIDSLLYVDFAQGIHGANPVSEYSPGPHLSIQSVDNVLPLSTVLFSTGHCVQNVAYLSSL